MAEIHFEDNNIELKTKWNKGLNDLGVNCLFRQNSQCFYVGTNSGINCITNAKVSNYNPLLDKYQITSIYGDSSDLWLGTYSKGLINCQTKNQENNLLFYENNDYNIRSISNNLVHDIFKDATGTLWIGTQDGLSFFDPLKQSFTNYSSSVGKENKLIDKNAWGIYEQGDSVIWIGNRKGITRINNKTGKYNNYPYYSENLNNPNGHDVYDVIVDYKNRVWASTNGGDNQVKTRNDY